MKKINVLLILPSNSIGGAEKVILSYFESFKNYKIKLSLVLTNNKYGSKLKKNLDVRQFNYSRFIFSIPKLISIINKEKFHIVLSTFPNISVTLILLKIIKLCRIKVIVRQPNMIGPSLHSKTKLIILKYIYKRVIKYADALIVTSKYMYNEALDSQIKRHKIHLLSNPISPYNTRLGVSPTRTEGKKIKFIFVGRLVYQKGIDRVLHLFKKNSNFELIIVGDGEEKEKLLAMTEKHGNKNNINFIGKKLYPFNLVAGADYFLLPSRWEGLPNCVLESLALGTPVISFKRIFALKDFKNNLKDNSLVLCKDEKTLEKYFFSLKRRKDYMKPKLRKSLLKNYMTTQSFQKSINKIILDII